MDMQKKTGSSSFVGRVFSLETLLVLVSLFFIYSGSQTGEVTQIFWGVMIGAGSVGLYFVRRKDWKKHWEEQEQIGQALDEARRRQKEKGQ